MRDDHESDDDTPNDPAAAFDALRAAVAAQRIELETLRRGVEAIFEQLDAADTAPRYDTELGKILNALVALTEKLDAVEQSPALRRPEQLTHVLQRSGEDLVSGAAKQLDTSRRQLDSLARHLAGVMDSARTRAQQRVHVCLAFAMGAALGLAAPRLIERAWPLVWGYLSS